MAKYRVCYEQTSCLYADVEANSPKEAYEIAEGMDGGDFTEDITFAEWRYLWALDEDGNMYSKYGNKW